MRRVISEVIPVLQQHSETTVLDFSSRYRDLGYDLYLRLDGDRQALHDSFRSLCDASAGTVCEEDDEAPDFHRGLRPAL